ncbi:hypothetical protein BpHYR1_048627 [Brachionus plicatilis]|uniref:Uncharacterized protein n=1 Tax=Brachionus plicatilis TaxID=10195 RepID=A0A3M7PV49_BRAPC|nr:hypothetical protein BpHYR1_048627 [Brachionus plicatilis]
MAKVCLHELSIQNFKAGKSASEIYEIIGRRSSLRTIRRWIKEFKDSDKLQNSKKPGRPRSAVTVSNKKKAYKKSKIPLLTESHVEKRLNFAQYWRKARSTEFKNLPIMFSDEKKFTVDGGLNKQNLTVYAISRDEAEMEVL